MVGERFPSRQLTQRQGEKVVFIATRPSSSNPTGNDRFRTQELAEFVRAASSRYDFDLRNVVAVGYSNGEPALLEACSSSTHKFPLQSHVAAKAGATAPFEGRRAQTRFPIRCGFAGYNNCTILISGLLWCIMTHGLLALRFLAGGKQFAGSTCGPTCGPRTTLEK